jgi:putative phosphoesterase
MRIALLADIHGNDLALQAVLEEIENNGGVDGYWILGDLVAIGHAPIKVLEMLQGLPHAHFVRGNTDRYVCSGDRPGPTTEDVMADHDLLAQRIEIEGDLCWTQGAVTAAGWLDWLSELPLEYRTKLPDNTRVLCVHASPGQDGGSGIRTGMAEKEVEALISGCQADLICVGHTHRPFNIKINDQRIINPGSVSNPVGRDVRACYAILDASKNGWDIKFYRAAYDYGRVLDLFERVNHPAKDFIDRHFRGEVD